MHGWPPVLTAVRIALGAGATADLVAVEGAEGLLLAVELGLGQALLLGQLLLGLLVVVVVDRLRKKRAGWSVEARWGGGAVGWGQRRFEGDVLPRGEWVFLPRGMALVMSLVTPPSEKGGTC